MKYLFYLILFSSCLIAQIEDPMKFFPSSVGNVWEYSTVTGLRRETIYKDSVDQSGYKFIFLTYNDYIQTHPAFKIDSTSKLIKSIYSDYVIWDYYYLDADSGDIWIAFYDSSSATYRMALCRGKYLFYYFGRPVICKDFTFFGPQPDTIINQYSFPHYTITLAYGIGEIINFDEGGAGPQRVLRGCIIDGDTLGVITSVDDNPVAAKYELYQNYPNPFNLTTTIKYSIAEGQHVKLTIYSSLGEEISVLINEFKSAGTHSIGFNAKGLPSGIYIYSIKTNQKNASKKLILLK